MVVALQDYKILESRKQSLNTNEEEIEEPTRKMSNDEVKSVLVFYLDP